MVESVSNRLHKLFQAERFDFLENRELIETFKQCHIVCDVCCKTVDGSLYHCEKRLHVHPMCAMLKDKISVAVVEEFKLQDGEANSDSKCLICKALKPKGKVGEKEGYRYESTSGDRILHVSCFNHKMYRNTDTKESGSAGLRKLFQANEVTFHAHPVLQNSYKEKGCRIVCDVCCMIVKGSLYHCKGGLDVHPACAMLKEKISVLVCEELKLKKREAKSDSKCVKCKELKPKGSEGEKDGFHYESMFGDRTLHVSCFNDTMYQNTDNKISNSTRLPKLFPVKLMFEFLEKPMLSGCNIACAVCCMTVEGEVFYCKEKKLYVHPGCAKLEEKIIVSWSGEDWTEFKLQEGEPKSKCVKCNGLKPKGSQGNIKGFHYESPCGNFTCHVSCFLDNSAVHKPKKMHRKIRQGNRVADEVIDEVFDDVVAIALPSLLADFSPIFSVVLKVATVIFSL